ncbi:putative Laccase-1 [Mycena indigotica]|uniref:laccase n=1 Tax=Mycena indigotica TaxID=2126181 RepID=A0A8H6TFS5_9AGAR|nr:putative Laccase-1 [Mycena indigotica]KAF7316551.1 putative Laccase-1 [Mycena indigotica]
MLAFLRIAAFIPSAFAAQHVFDLSIVNTKLAPDGFVRDTVVPNGTFPGPTFAVNKGDSVVIHTHNKLTDALMRRSTSIHWHGFFQARTSGMDGPSFVNQCPIAPGTTFDYVFDTAGQTGNYWYHSHLSTQYCDGLRGAFVVYDPNDPLKSLYDVDDASTIITLAEWYHVLAPAGQDSFFKTGIVPVQDSGLINGVGRFNGGPLVPYAVITVKQGLRYRFRVFSLSCRPFMTLSFDNHTFDVIELDGVEHDPVPFQNADVYAAQRISVVLHANQSVDNYWIRAPPTGGSSANNPNFNSSLTLAILRYEGAPAVEPTTVNVPGPKMDDGLMHPIASERPGKLGSGPPDFAVTLNIAQPNLPFFDINGISYQSPSLPALLQLLSGASKPQDLIPSENLILLPPNSIVDISIPGTGAHPFHLHGHNFDVILQSNAGTKNFVNPPRRDVTPINGGNTTFRFFTDNPGAWFLHCHIDWHLEAGLAVVFGEAPSANRAGPQSQIQTAQWKQLCPTYDALAPEFQ